MTRRQFIMMLAATVIGCARRRVTSSSVTTLPATLPQQRIAASRPNVILIVADDLGYGELGCYGGRDVPTPNIDSLAANGIRFTDGYVTCPVCSPTRAALLTGRYQQRFGHEFNPGPAPVGTFGLALDQVTLPQLLNQSGYTTGMVGKWHLGSAPQYLPQDRGFHEFFGFLGGAHSYMDLKKTDRAPIFRGTTPVDEDEYLTDAFAREACAFIDQYHDQSFFLYLAFNSIHTPLQAPQKYLDRFKSIPDPRRRTMCAMLSAMDDAVGRVIETLREHGLEDDTLIIFISDNGGPTQGNTSRNDPLSGTKGTVWEGGIRVPYIVQWKRHFPAGRVEDAPVSSLDILPTTLTAAGAQIPRDRLDGRILQLSAATCAPAEVLYWRFGEQWAVRKGNYKVMKVPGRQPMLFDLSNDPAEKHDLAAENPQIVAELREAYQQWEKQLQPPKWGRTRRQRQRRRVQPQTQPLRRTRQRFPASQAAD